MEEHYERMRQAGERLRTQLTVLALLVGLAWLLEIVDALLLKQGLNLLGIRPRQLYGLRGILFMPLLHGGLAHVAANTLPFIVLGWLVMLRRFADFFTVTAVTQLLTGAGIWLFGRDRSVYIGASGLVFGYLGFLLLRGFFERSVHAVIIAMLVALSYGGLLVGVLPLEQGISWEAHLFGFLSGALAAWLLTPRTR